SNTEPPQPAAPLVRNQAALRSGPSFPGWRGNSPKKRVPDANMQIVPTSAIAEIAAEPRPTVFGGKDLAATHEYANPSTDVTAVVLINDPALTKITKLVLIH